MCFMNLIGVFFKGFVMGAANVVPGVSGGTIAFVFGIYERLINAIKAFDVKAVKMLMGRRFREFVRYVDLWFLVSLGLGVVVSVFTLAKLLEIGFEKYPILIAALFFGLIAASVWSVAKMVKVWSLGAIVGLLIGCGVAVAMAVAPEANESKNLFYLMLCGVVALCSMIIPGVSGSFVLLLMGNYQLIMISSVNKLREGKFEESLPVLIPVGVGAVVGFVAGSLVIIWPWKKAGEIIVKGGEEKVLSYERYFPVMDRAFWMAAGVMIVGVGLMLVVDKMGATKEK